MLVTMTLDFDLPCDAAVFAAVSAALNTAPQVPAPETAAVALEAAPAEPRKRGRPAKTAVVPLPDAPVAEQPAPVPVVEQPAPAPVAEQLDLFAENTHHYAPTLDDVKAALQVYFAKDRAGAITLVQSYGVQQFSHLPPDKFSEFIAKCEAAIAA